MKGILGRKIGMSQVFTVEGTVIPVTVIEVEPNVITEIRTKTSHGYNAIQLAVADKRENIVSKPLKGHFKKANTTPKTFVREIREMTGFELGATVACDLFTSGEFVDVSSISKGKGFAGVIKRHNFSRGPMAHGSGFHREGGSNGAIAPNRVFKNKKMPGRMGYDKVTAQNLEVILVDQEKNAILVKGSIPGPKKSFVVITSAIKNKKNKAPVNLLNNQKQIVSETNNENAAA